MKYKLIKRRNPSNPYSYNKFHAIPVYHSLVDMKEIAKEISERSSLSSGDVFNVLQNLTDILPRYLTDGKRIQLGDLGIFRLLFSSEGVDNKDDFKLSKIRGIKINFSAGKEIKKQIKNIRFEKE